MHDVGGDLCDAADEHLAAARCGDGVHRLNLVSRGHRVQRGGGADRQERTSVGDAGRRGGRPDPDAAGKGSAGRRDQSDVGDPGQAGGIPVQFGRAVPLPQISAVGDDDAHPGIEVAGEAGAQLIADLVRRGAFGQYPVVRVADLDAQEREPEKHQQRDDGQTDRDGPTHHEFR